MMLLRYAPVSEHAGGAQESGSMDALAILIGFIALLLALNARKAVKALVLQLAGHAARVRELEVELERLRRLRPDVPPPAPDAAPEAAPPASPVAPETETRQP